MMRMNEDLCGMWRPKDDSISQTDVSVKALVGWQAQSNI